MVKLDLDYLCFSECAAGAQLVVAADISGFQRDCVRPFLIGETQSV